MILLLDLANNIGDIMSSFMFFAFVVALCIYSENKYK
jgi:hypothetical protein